VLDRYGKYNMKILLEDFNEKARREYVFIIKIGNDSLHELIKGLTQRNAPTLQNP
jgi:hypothetical protein